MEIISFVNQKGGVSKTTSCVNIGAFMGQLGKKVLLIDFDSQGNLTQSVGIYNFEFQDTIYDCLLGKSELYKIIKKTNFENLSIVPANMNLANAEGELALNDDKEKTLQKIIEAAQLENDFDYILIDCSPSLSLLTINALVASDSIIIPLEPSIFALNGLGQLIKVLKLVQRKVNPKLEVKGVFLTRVDSRSTLSKEFQKQLEDIFKEKLFKTVIHQNVELAKAQISGEPINFYNKFCKGYNEYLTLTKEVLKLEKEKYSFSR